MSYKPSYKRGDWKADCDQCGRTFKASQLRKRWDGLMVCSSDWEPRHTQDYVRAKADYQANPWSRPEPQDTFDNVNTPQWIAGYAISGYAFPGTNISPISPVPPSTFP